MGAVKANNNKDTYKATAVAFIVIGTLFLINKLLKIIFTKFCFPLDKKIPFN